jgi:hypothetical protein
MFGLGAKAETKIWPSDVSMMAVSPRASSSAAGPTSSGPTSRFAPAASPVIAISSAIGRSSRTASAIGATSSGSRRSTKMCTVPPHGSPTSKASSSAMPYVFSLGAPPARTSRASP